MPTRFQFICVNGDRQSVIYYLVTLADLRVIFNNPNLDIFHGKEEYLISRSEILKDYYFFKKPLLATYVSLFQDDISENESIDNT